MIHRIVPPLCNMDDIICRYTILCLHCYAHMLLVLRACICMVFGRQQVAYETNVSKREETAVGRLHKQKAYTAYLVAE